MRLNHKLNSRAFKLNNKEKRNRLLITISRSVDNRMRTYIKTGKGGYASGFIETGINLLFLLFTENISNRMDMVDDVVERLANAWHKPEIVRWNIKIILDRYNQKFTEKAIADVEDIDG